MCYLQGQPVGEYCSCCQRCNDYLSICVPVVRNGYVVGECDFDFCDYCPYYEVCQILWEGVDEYETVKL